MISDALTFFQHHKSQEVIRFIPYPTNLTNGLIHETHRLTQLNLIEIITSTLHPEGEKESKSLSTIDHLNNGKFPTF